MFQNSYFNSTQLNCLYHRSKITHICADYKCNQHPFFCPQCLNSYSYNLKHAQHQSQIKPFQQVLDTMSVQVYQIKKPIQKMYKNLLLNKDSQSLLKWQQEKQQHYISIHNHINSIKHLLQQEIQNMCRKFKTQLLIQKTQLNKQLDQYEILYRQKLQEFAKFTQPIATMNNTYKYCANKNNIVLKLVSQNNDKQMIAWFNNLKRVIRLTQKVQKDPLGYDSQVKRLAKITNQLMDDLPRIKGNFGSNLDTQYQRESLKIYSETCAQILRIFVKVKESPNLNRSYSMQGFNGSTWKYPK